MENRGELNNMSEAKQKEIELWKKWKSEKTNENLSPLLKSVEPIITTHVNKLSGNLPRSAIRAQAIKLTIDAFDNYDPTKAQLNTHLYSRLQKLNRYVYEHQNIGTIPEPRIIQIGTYNRVRSNLEDQLGRPPTTQELADELKWSKKQLDLLEKEMRKDLVQDFSYVNVSDDSRADIDEHLALLHSELHGTDKAVMEYLYGMDGKPVLSNSDIAKKLNISQSMVTQIKTRLANRLRTSGALVGY